MKSALKILLILAIAAFLVVSFVKIGGKEKEIVCQGMDLVVEDSLSLGLISRDEVLGIIRDKKMVFEGKNISDINMGNVERTLCKSPYIDTVLCSLTASGKVHLTVIPKIPALHVMADNGEEYYLDRRGEDMPVGNITGNLTIATGRITKDFARKKLAPLATCIQDSSFWRAQVQQIDVCANYDVRLYTRFADHTVLLGEPTDIPDKLWRLRVFYEKGLPETGWNKYQSISVEYENIVIGKRHDKK